MQTEPWWTENVAKLTRSGHTELHVALRVHESGVPFALLCAIMDGDTIPVGDPAGPSVVPEIASPSIHQQLIESPLSFFSLTYVPFGKRSPFAIRIRTWNRPEGN
jgi:hypothetical protein